MVLVTKSCKKLSVLLSGKTEVIVYRKLSVYKKIHEACFTEGRLH